MSRAFPARRGRANREGGRRRAAPPRRRQLRGARRSPPPPLPAARRPPLLPAARRRPARAGGGLCGDLRVAAAAVPPWLLSFLLLPVSRVVLRLFPFLFSFTGVKVKEFCFRKGT